jgi:hypothetical protein
VSDNGVTRWRGWFFDDGGQWVALPLWSSSRPRCEALVAEWADTNRVPAWRTAVRQTQPPWCPIDPTPAGRKGRTP